MEDDFGVPERKSDNITQSEGKGVKEGRSKCFLRIFLFRQNRKHLAESFFLLLSSQGLTKMIVNGKQNQTPIKKKLKNYAEVNGRI